MGTTQYLMRFSSEQPSEEAKLCDSCFTERHQKSRGYSFTPFEPRPKLGVKPRLMYHANRLALMMEQAAV